MKSHQQSAFIRHGDDPLQKTPVINAALVKRITHASVDGQELFYIDASELDPTLVEFSALTTTTVAGGGSINLGTTTTGTDILTADATAGNTASKLRSFTAPTKIYLNLAGTVSAGAVAFCATIKN